ncbi:histidine kinase [Alteromonas sp. C1M14]|uniref:sensor histidine kinase n=1 Tax=Alteromonas sp. C1M14 TaxID=2841567 RepID=UPI001C08CE4A|nr:histidine kinase [Alteromonas sp. C1M14]MBU2978525.1 histidine kinase [Alteromonas sp. C1M14]
MSLLTIWSNVNPPEKYTKQQKPSFWLLHSLGWLLYAIILTIDNVAFIGSEKLNDKLVILPLLISGLFAFMLTLPLRYLYHRLWSLSPARLFITATLCSFAIALMWTPLKNMIIWDWEDHYSVWLTLTGHFDGQHQLHHLFMTISYAFFMVMVWSSLYFGINYHYRLVEEKEQHFLAVTMSQKAQIKMLRYQINPHFLFNTLNGISSLVLQGKKDIANAMLAQLSTFFRYSLDNDPEKKITLEEELRALALYLDIEKARFGDRLSIVFEVNSDTKMLLVPSLILQPLVENAIKHGISKMKTGGEIRIKAYCEKEHLILQVADNGPFTHLDQNKQNEPGIGLKNIDERLNVIYPLQHQLKLSVAEPHGFMVTTSLPIERAL